jgi:UDP-GlcNAc:undecaprenyl-phosphate GlcNAc-1-phosphate transferase
MGDAGSMTIGFLAGALSIQASSKTATTFTLGVPLVLMSVPLFDTAMAILRRKLTGRSIGEGDRGHIHHRLQDRGLSRRQALMAIAGLTLIMSGAALLSVLLQSESYGLAICAGVLALLILGRIFGYHETSLIFRHLKEIGDLLVDTSGVLQTRLLLARLDSLDARQRSRLWEHVVERVAQMKGARVEYTCRTSDEYRPISHLSWENLAASDAPGGAQWRVVYEVPRADGLVAEFEASGCVAEPDDPPRMDDLIRLFAKVGLELPARNELPAASPSPQDEDDATILFPAPASPQPLRHAA